MLWAGDQPDGSPLATSLGPHPTLPVCPGEHGTRLSEANMISVVIVFITFKM